MKKLFTLIASLFSIEKKPKQIVKNKQGQNIFELPSLFILYHKYINWEGNNYELIGWRDSDDIFICPVFSSIEKWKNWMNNGGRDLIKLKDGYFCKKTDWKIMARDVILEEKEEPGFLDIILRYFGSIPSSYFHLDMDAGEISVPEERRYTIPQVKS